MRVRAVAAAFVAGLLVVGCGDPMGPSVPEGPPSVEGTILFWTSIPTPPDVTPGVSIRIQRAAPACNDITVHVTITPQRFGLRLPDGTLQAAMYEDLEEGLTVRAWVPESVVMCPFDGSATFVELVP